MKGSGMVTAAVLVAIGIGIGRRRSACLPGSDLQRIERRTTCAVSQ